jgi:hypothetical protein
VVCPLEHVLERLEVEMPLRAVLPVVVGQLPALERVAFALLEALQLLVLGDVQPELDHDPALLAERALELGDGRIGALPLLAGGEPVDALHEHPPVPGAVEDGHAAQPRQRRPEAPQEVVALLDVRRRAVLRHAHVPGVERLLQALLVAAPRQRQRGVELV